MKTICIILLLIFSIPHKISSSKIENYFFSEEVIVTTEREIPSIDINIATYDYDLYLRILGKLESNDNYKVINRLGYLGKYQFSRLTLKQLYNQKKLSFDIYQIGINMFLDSEELQEEAIQALTNSNFSVIKNYGLLEYRFRKIDGVFITNEGMLAAAHLLGPKAVRDYLYSNGMINKADANGTSVKDYLAKYQLIYN